MTSTLRSWLSYGMGYASGSSNDATPTAPSSSAEDDTESPTITRVSPPPDDEDGSETETEDDHPPAFPSLNSAQRASASTSMPPPSKPSASSSILSAPTLVPPPNPSLAVRQPGLGGLAPPPAPAAGGSLMVPPTTTKPPTKTKKREKVALAPGCGPLDWANLKSSGTDLRGVDSLMRVTPSVLKEHRTKEDAWTAINGKVYNITSYLPFHPGGEKELMRVVGRDGTKLFALTHAWVNADFMLDACLVGFLVSDRNA